MKLYEVTVLLNAVKSPDGETTSEAEIILGPMAIVADDLPAAALLAGRGLTDAQVAAPSRIVVVVNARSGDLDE
jgi:hypothetical protein